MENNKKLVYGDRLKKGSVVKHCKKEYTVLIPYSDKTNEEVISTKGKEYKIVRLPRPAKNESDLMCVFVDGIRYPSFAKFLKTLS